MRAPCGEHELALQPGALEGLDVSHLDVAHHNVRAPDDRGGPQLEGHRGRQLPPQIVVGEQRDARAAVAEDSGGGATQALEVRLVREAPRERSHFRAERLGEPGSAVEQRGGAVRDAFSRRRRDRDDRAGRTRVGADAHTRLPAR